MDTYKAFMGVGIVIIIIGFLLMSSMTIYYYSTARTVGEMAVKFAVLALGFGVYKKGERMRDRR